MLEIDPNKKYSISLGEQTWYHDIDGSTIIYSVDNTGKEGLYFTFRRPGFQPEKHFCQLPFHISEQPELNPNDDIPF